MIYDYKTDHDAKYSSYNPSAHSDTGRVRSRLLQRFTALLHSEVIGRQASVVDVENQAGIVGGGIKHLERVDKTKELFRL